MAESALEPARTSTRGASLLVFGFALAVLAPTTGDFGLTYDEPAYIYSQQISIQWWERLAEIRSRADLETLIEPDTLLYYWPYARHGINFHPPLAGQSNLLTYVLFRPWLREIVARRMSSVLCFATTVTILFAFLTRRYGSWVGALAAGTLLLMPRLYGQAHLVDTDIPGLLLWVAIALVFWKGWETSNARGWRCLLGILLGMAFLEKMATVTVLLPIVIWLVAAGWSRRSRPPGAFLPSAFDALITLGPMLAILITILVELQRLATALPLPQFTNLFVHKPKSMLPDFVLALPLLWWLLRRVLFHARRGGAILGQERPTLETLAVLMAIPPVVVWAGNPAWWQETLPRLAHYLQLNTARRGALPDIQILYFGQLFEFSLPWHNAWVLIAITVPVGILITAAAGLIWGLTRIHTDRLPLYFMLHMITLPVLRMLPTPAHDGVRLFLPTFAFLAAFSAWGAVTLADIAARITHLRPAITRTLSALALLAPAAWSLASIHPYELSYYNSLIGGPRGAWEAGFELSYWYDAFTPQVIRELNDRLPQGASVSFPNRLSSPSTFQDLQAMGELRGDIQLGTSSDRYPFLWLLTHDSKASANTRILFALEPWYAVRPRQLGGAQVLAVASPKAAARSIALQLLADAPDPLPPPQADVPPLVRKYMPWLGRLWGEGITRAARLQVNEAAFDWARTDHEGIMAAARDIVAWVKEQRARGDDSRNLSQAFEQNDATRRLASFLTRYDGEFAFSADLLRKDPDALLDAVTILIRRPKALRAVLTRYGYTNPESIGGYLDAGMNDAMTTPGRPPDRATRAAGTTARARPA